MSSSSPLSVSPSYGSPSYCDELVALLSLMEPTLRGVTILGDAGNFGDAATLCHCSELRGGVECKLDVRAKVGVEKAADVDAVNVDVVRTGKGADVGLDTTSSSGWARCDNVAVRATILDDSRDQRFRIACQ